VNRDRGSASLWLLGVGLAVVLLGAVAATVASAVVARHRAQAAADLGALAGAVRAAQGEAAACARAAELVRANLARLVGCRLDGLDLVVTAEVGPARASARAGPVRTEPTAEPTVEPTVEPTAEPAAGPAARRPPRTMPRRHAPVGHLVRLGAPADGGGNLIERGRDASPCWLVGG
jgi:secretion/DNA translocation related TadE-like protein